VVSELRIAGVHSDMMLLHAGALIGPAEVWTAWSFEPAVVALLGATITLHVRGMRRISRLSTRNTARIQRESLFFISGCAVLALALLSPVHRLGETLFSAHMVQHELLMAIAAPLLILGRPFVPMLWALPASARKSVGGLMKRRALQNAWALASNPFSAWLLHAAAIWVWHVPRFYDASVHNSGVHTAQHMSFLVTALLFWWSVLSPHAIQRGAGVSIISLFTTGVHTTLLGALIATSDQPLFRAYNISGTSLWGMTPLADQQLGGVVMWIPAGVVYLFAALYLFPGWIRASGRRVKRMEAGRARLAANVGHSVVAAILFFVTMSCAGGMSDQQAGELTGGNPHRGAEAIRRYGCKSCHSIPGISGANALVGPPLSGIASRSYIAGVLVNKPDNMITWLRNPPAVDDKTGMPNMGVTEKDARDIAAYLYKLR
jgi:putative membrane protein